MLSKIRGTVPNLPLDARFRHSTSLQLQRELRRSAARIPRYARRCAIRTRRSLVDNRSFVLS